MIGSSSPYVSDFSVLRSDTQFRGYDPDSGVCHFRYIIFAEQEMDPTTVDTAAAPNGYRFTIVLHLDMDYTIKKFTSVPVYMDLPLVDFLIGSLLNSDATREYVCSIMANNCGMADDHCLQRMVALPVAGLNTRIDENNQGCRILHAAFAATNPAHCAHIAFDPTPDPNGKIKCQVSEQLKAEDFFTPEDFEAFSTFQKEVGISPGVGFKVN